VTIEQLSLFISHAIQLSSFKVLEWPGMRGVVFPALEPAINDHFWLVNDRLPPILIFSK
jgi:hypothetical protein